MALGTRELDLTDRVEQIRERLEEIADEKDEVQQELAEELANSDVDGMEDLDSYDDYEQRYDDLDAEETELRGELRKFKETCVDWATDTNTENLWNNSDTSDEYYDKIGKKYDAEVESVTFGVRELTFGQLQRVSDDMMEESFEVDMQREDVEGTPRQGFYQTELLKEAIEHWPEEAPVKTEYGHDIPEPGEYPIPVGEWLFERVDAINTTGDTEMGNSSLKEAMKSDR
jgi:chromosome segregation ATPase